MTQVFTQADSLETDTQDKPTSTRTPINAHREGKAWVLSGGTFFRRRSIQFSAPGKTMWDSLAKVWRIYVDTLPAEIIRIIEESGGTITGEPVATQRDAQAAEPLEFLPQQPQLEEQASLFVTRAEPVTNQFVKPSYWDRLVRYLNPQRPRPAIALVGPTGNGKTTVAEAVLSALEYRYLVIDCNAQMEPVDLIGGMSFERKPDGSASEVWRDGPVTRAFREGMAVLFNEFDTLNARTALCLQSAFQDAGSDGKGRYITLSGNPSEDRVMPAGACPLILTMNTFGTGPTAEFVGRNALDMASMDRISIIPTGYENEREILLARGYGESVVQTVVRWSQAARSAVERNGIKAFVSMRLLLRLCESMAMDGLKFEQAIAEEFLDRFAAEDRALLENVR